MKKVRISFEQLVADAAEKRSSRTGLMRLVLEAAEKHGLSESDWSELLRRGQNDSLWGKVRECIHSHTDPPTLTIETRPFIPEKLWRRGIRMNTDVDEQIAPFPYDWNPEREEVVIAFSGNTTFANPDTILLRRSFLRFANVSVYDALRQNQQYIPRRWRLGRHGEPQWIAFPGTIYEDTKGFEIVLILRWLPERESWQEDEIIPRCLSGYHPNILIPYYGA